MGAPQLPDDAESSPPWHTPFGYRDYRLLWLTNIAEFVGRSMSAVALSVWLYEASGSGMVLGGLGAVAMVIQVPTIPLGGVLADELDRKKLVSACQACSAATCAVSGSLCLGGLLSIWQVYIAVAALQLGRQLEESARGAITGAVVPPDAVPAAVSINQITSAMGEVLSPVLFFCLVGTSEGQDKASLWRALAAAAVAYTVAAAAPQFIAVEGRAEGRAEGADAEPVSWGNRRVEHCSTLY